MEAAVGGTGRLLTWIGDSRAGADVAVSSQDAGGSVWAIMRLQMLDGKGSSCNVPGFWTHA